MSVRKDESFADMFARGDVPVAKRQRLAVGIEVEGTIGHVGADAVFIDLDDKQQAFFEVVDLRDARGEIGVKVGDRIKGWVVDTSGGQIKLARRVGRDARGAGNERFRTAFESGMPVEGKVTAINKGGAEIDLGGARGFCPLSQLDERYVQEPASFVGRALTFLITKLDDRDVVLSRRALLERESKDKRERALATLTPGVIIKGRVSQVREFGAFVDLDGIEGLVPARELSHDRVKPENVVKPGDLLEVMVKAIDKKTDAKGQEKIEITLSLKALATDPWSAIEAVAPVGRVVAGQVSRLAEFGAFVRLASGVEGLLHVSELGARVKHPKDALSIGQSVLVRVISVDLERKRIALAPASEGAGVGSEDAGARVVVGAIVRAVVEKVESYGVVVQLAGTRGRAGRAVIPNAETGTRPGADLRKELPAGKEITAKVIEATDQRVRLSIKAAADDAERADYDQFRAAQGGAGMGTLGDLLKKKLEAKR